MMTLGSRVCGWGSGRAWPVWLESFEGYRWGGWPFKPGFSWSLIRLGGVKRLVFTTDAMWTGEGELDLRMMRSSSTCCDAWTEAGLWLGSMATLRSPECVESWKLLDDPWAMQGGSSLRSIFAVRRSICSTTWMKIERNTYEQTAVEFQLQYFVYFHFYSTFCCSLLVCSIHVSTQCHNHPRSGHPNKVKLCNAQRSLKQPNLCTYRPQLACWI